MPNLADLQRAELAAALGGAVWAAVLWWLEHGRDVAPTDAAAAILTLLNPGLNRVAHASPEPHAPPGHVEGAAAGTDHRPTLGALKEDETN